jgi:hypothetical protein
MQAISPWKNFLTLSEPMLLFSAQMLNTFRISSTLMLYDLTHPLAFLLQQKYLDINPAH